MVYLALCLHGTSYEKCKTTKFRAVPGFCFHRRWVYWLYLTDRNHMRQVKKLSKAERISTKNTDSRPRRYASINSKPINPPHDCLTNPDLALANWLF